MAERGLGKWILPQPKNKEYVTIPRISRTIPFGYKVEHKNVFYLIFHLNKKMQKSIDLISRLLSKTPTYNILDRLINQIKE
jgi:hypothetical protein